jgi:hypothetical protein
VGLTGFIWLRTETIRRVFVKTVKRLRIQQNVGKFKSSYTNGDLCRCLTGGNNVISCYSNCGRSVGIVRSRTQSPEFSLVLVVNRIHRTLNYVQI